MTPKTPLPILALALWLGGPAGAQSVITLESFDLAPAPAATPTPAAPPAPAGCLVDPGQPGCAAGASSRSFTLNDVVNLGIIDRAEVEVASPGGVVVRVEDRVAPLPSVDIEVLFDYDSAVLRPDQLAPLAALARDLAGIDFGRAQLVLMGHTDGVGSAAYNRALSQRRAAAVAAFLSEAAAIPPQRIRASGMGFDYLRYPQDPAHPGNRRVQILLVQ